MSNPLMRRGDPQAAALLHLYSAALPQYLTREQVPQLVAACRIDRDRMFCRIAFETGGRVSELIALKGSDLDLANRQIRLESLKRRSRDRRRSKQRFFRWIPVSDSLCADLANYLLHLEIDPSQRDTIRLFPFTRQQAHKIISQAGRKAGLIARGGREISPHILRHSFAMNCLVQGVPLTIVKDLLGHVSISSTMVYLKTDPALAREFLGKVKF